MSENNFPKMPELTVTKNGYQIRSEILHLAKDFVQQEYQVKVAGWELSAVKDENTGKLVTTVGMPEFPGLDKILETAERMYTFVSKK